MCGPRPRLEHGTYRLGGMARGAGEQHRCSRSALRSAQVGAAPRVPGRDTLPRSQPYVRAETGADFRALRDMLHALDPDNEKNWGGLSPVTRPEGLRIIYLCPHHIHDLDYPYTAPARPSNA